MTKAFAFLWLDLYYTPSLTASARLIACRKLGILKARRRAESNDRSYEGDVMKAMIWYSRGVYPLDAYERDSLCAISFLEADGTPCDRVLLSGVSGTGKSTVLAGIAAVWRAVEALRSGGEAELWSGETALLMDGLLDKPVLCICARGHAFWDEVAGRHPGLTAIGWIQNAPQSAGLADLLRERWGSAEELPNVLLVRQDERDDLRARDDLGEQLISLHRTAPDRAQRLLGALAALIYGKRIVMENGSPLVRLERGGEHALDALSSGERRIVSFLTSIAANLRPGGVLLLDEPDMHLHPSQVLGLLTTMEQLALPAGGQMFLTSHTPEVWRRYNNLGVNVRLEERE